MIINDHQWSLVKPLNASTMTIMYYHDLQPMWVGESDEPHIAEICSARRGRNAHLMLTIPLPISSYTRSSSREWSFSTQGCGKSQDNFLVHNKKGLQMDSSPNWQQRIKIARYLCVCVLLRSSTCQFYPSFCYVLSGTLSYFIQMSVFV